MVTRRNKTDPAGTGTSLSKITGKEEAGEDSPGNNSNNNRLHEILMRWMLIGCAGRDRKEEKDQHATNVARLGTLLESVDQEESNKCAR